MQPIRRRQLMDATIRAIHRHGFNDTTVARIGAIAGLSPGIIHHYFGGKNELLAATMRSLLEELRVDFTARLAATRTPLDRIDAVLAANFEFEQFRPEILAAWLAFWSQAPFAPPLARLRRLYTRRALSNLRAPLGELVGREEAARIALTLMALIDGFWLRAAQGDRDVTGPAALAIARATLRRGLAEAGAGPLDLQESA